ncbi:DNA polymerase III subunit gamma/tau [Fructobacillus evanidus]|uniref:DNA-directed DNA polymerase n=1 Tax=Fructobacillus evanidus TaxID=3064281 RepID=A0ABM9MRN7_9LACO|nr:DNA polymerase III [Fructobacillus sp. LMG 32999]CAK1235123.1 DNA polymerase III [Fructobacillus sp. LMG 32999]CAK1235482.1 DNA polymerase III [Fructobacillus sp. LMG 32999]CAK1235574.1 DNA polymerase III [Fructobacillus sp. LMG 32999]CAK1238174.1 DNA polymerase III [Fructobacillus sp. LMG 32999]
MAYQALYRVYRPRTFEQMVGQEVITKTLENAIEQKQTGHAYLFSGPRGTGKTSAAKIFAREVNGIGQDQANESHPDIIEIDAASNNGVDEIRSIRDSANYAPIEAPFKIYIIDEAHMLSTGAFNALLKTLEEPPAQVKFILATTEVQKMPATILSRTQRFEFKRLSNETIKNRMIEILHQENQAYEDQALDVVATAAEGGMRDALSILDQVIAYGPEKITLENALTVTGSVKIDQLLTYLNQVLDRDTAAALATLSAILLAGKDANRFLADLMATLRDVMLVDLAPDLVKATSKVEELKAFKSKISQDQLQQMLVVIDDVKTQLAASQQSDIYLEILTVKLTLSDQEKNQPTSKGQSTQTPLMNGANEKQGKPTAQANASVQDKPATAEPVETKQATASGAKVAERVQVRPANTAAVDQPVQQNAVPSTRPDQNADLMADADFAGEEPGSPVEPEVSRPVAEPTQSAADTQEQVSQAKEPVSRALPTVYTGQEPVQAVLSQAKRERLTQAQNIWPDLVKGFAVKDQAVLQTVEPMASSDQALILAFDFPAIMDASLQNTDLLANLAAALRENQLPETLVLRSKDEWQNDRAAYVAALRSGQKIEISLADLTPTVLEANHDQVAAVTEVADQENVNQGPDLVQEAKDLFGDDLVVVTKTDDEGK